MCGLFKIFALSLLASSAAAESQVYDLAVLNYKALQYSEMENLEHLSFIFDFCLCPSSFKGLLPNKAKECQCTTQQGRKVIESIPQAVFSASCVLSYTPGKCLNAKFTGTNLGRKMLVRVTLGKSIFTYPSWQPLVNSRYKTVSTLRSATGSDMRITYISVSRRMKADTASWAKEPSTTTIVPWKRKQPTELSLNVEPSTAGFRSDIFDILRDGFNKGKTWAVKSVNKLTGEEDLKQGTYSKNKSASKPWLVLRNTTKQPKMTKTTMTTRKAIEFTTRPPAKTATRDPWDLSDVAFLRSVPEITNYLFKKSRTEKVDPAKYDAEAVKKSLLFYHNVYRERHDAPEVKSTPFLNILAQRYSDELARKASCLVHETPRKYGENLFVYGASSYPDPDTFAKAVTQSFYMESFGYNYNSWIPHNYHKTGHFTQLVWRDSRHIGVGVSVVKIAGKRRGCFSNSPAYMIYVCVKYDPAGNFESSEAYKRNVLPLKRF